MKTIQYDPADSEYMAYFAADRFVRMSKEAPDNWDGPRLDSEDEPLTFIYLDNGEVLASYNSMKSSRATTQ